MQPSTAGKARYRHNTKGARFRLMLWYRRRNWDECFMRPDRLHQLKSGNYGLDCALRQGSAGAKKDAEQAFYSGVLADLNSFKDEFRNMVAHVRGSYHELRALRALNQVKNFMNRIGERFDEDGKKIRG